MKKIRRRLRKLTTNVGENDILLPILMHFSKNVAHCAIYKMEPPISILCFS